MKNNYLTPDCDVLYIGSRKVICASVDSASGTVNDWNESSEYSIF